MLMKKPPAPRQAPGPPGAGLSGTRGRGERARRRRPRTRRVRRTDRRDEPRGGMWGVNGRDVTSGREGRDTEEGHEGEGDRAQHRGHLVVPHQRPDLRVRGPGQAGRVRRAELLICGPEARHRAAAGGGAARLRTAVRHPEIYIAQGRRTRYHSHISRMLDISRDTRYARHVSRDTRCARYISRYEIRGRSTSCTQ